MSNFELVTYKSVSGNVGDDFSEWLFKKALGSRIQKGGNTLLFGVGSILSKHFDDEFRKSCDQNCVVFGSGARGPAHLPDTSRGAWKFYCVRGPLTASLMRLDPKLAMSDPAILAPLLIPAKEIPKRYVGIVPYYTASEDAWEKVAKRLGWKVISPHLQIEQFVAELSSCTSVWCESMHGAIFADAYRIPWRPISGTSLPSEGRTHAFKWTDWCSSVGLSFDPMHSFSFGKAGDSAYLGGKKIIKASILANRLEKEKKLDRHQLSELSVLQSRQEQLIEALQKMSWEQTGRSLEVHF
ncbi:MULTISPECIES: polysaccharide pyruvyl transferase family protein [Pseudomonadota]|jgi:succinoglycan biosynthesis protein ExoV|uniref:polysaccharide pyruvyl transferase family protein n=1 Tax=Pseudomonadota TaxID=1224 RepID=UPI003A920513